MKKLGCATLLMVLLVLACVVKASMLQAHSPTLPTPTIPASSVAVGQPRMDPHHSVQLVRSGSQLQVLGRQDQGPTYVTTLCPWIQAGPIAALACATFPSAPCLHVYALPPPGATPARVS